MEYVVVDLETLCKVLEKGCKIVLKVSESGKGDKFLQVVDINKGE